MKTSRAGALTFTILFGAVSVTGAGGSHAQGLLPRVDAARAQQLIAQLDLDEARRSLQSADGNDARVALEKARLALYELDCDGAVVLLGRPEVLSLEGAGALGDVARGCQRAIAATAVTRDNAAEVEIRWQDQSDAALGPLLIETITKAREAIARDLRVDWPRPTRVVVVRDLLSLSALTGLPYESAQTTGTVAVAKWGHVTLLSPRAPRHGYAWRDTVAHELSHLAVTRASGDLAPLWLQEGVAKREEARWRSASAFDDRPSPDAVAERGIELGLALPLDKLGPSIAMLPSAEEAMVAFAEVTSFVRYFLETQPDGALPSLLSSLKSGQDVGSALKQVSGADLKAWDVRWRAQLSGRPRTALPEGLAASLARAAAHRPGGGGSASETQAARDLHEDSRLAELLEARGHAEQALSILDRISARAASLSVGARRDLSADPSLRWLRARALEDEGRAGEASSWVADPHDVTSSYAPWWAVRGRFARLAGDESTAAASFLEAVSADPFEPEAVCEVRAQPSEGAEGGAGEAGAVCGGERGEPVVGGD